MRQEDLRTIYVAYIKAQLDYGSAVYLHLAAPTNQNAVQKKQNEAARIITVCCCSSPLSALSKEENLIPVNIHADMRAACAFERQQRLHNHFPTADLIRQPSTRTHLKADKNWRASASKIPEYLHLREDIKTDTTPPWLNNNAHISFHPRIEGAAKAQSLASRRKDLGIAAVDALRPWSYCIWTDGSVTGGITDGGSGAFIDDTDNNTTFSLVAPAGAICSSYTAEAKAMLLGIEKVAQLERERNQPPTAPRKMVVCSDSQSVIVKLASGWQKQTTQAGFKIHQLCNAIIDEHNIDIIFQWVPSHVGIHGNEMADQLANDGSDLGQDLVPLDFATARAAIERHGHEEWDLAYEAAVQKPSKDIANINTSMKWHNKITKGRIPDPIHHLPLERRERVILNQFRTGHSPIIPYYLHRIGRNNSPNICPSCAYTPFDREHILDCPALFPFRIKNSITASSFHEPMASHKFLELFSYNMLAIYI
jgi:ribonuclease HI